MKPIIAKRKRIPTHQSRFTNVYSTIEQVHRIVDTMEQILEISIAVFLCVYQASGKNCHKRLKCQKRALFPKEYSNILKCYIKEWNFRVKEGEYSGTKHIKATTKLDYKWLCKLHYSFKEAATITQVAQDSIITWMSNCRINFNYKESKKYSWSLKKKPVPFVNEAEHLGMNLDSNGKTYRKKVN